MKASDTYNSNYTFSIFWSEEDEAFIAICPDFPGVSAFGDTEEQALAEAKIALKLAIETYEEEGWELPKPKVLDKYSGQMRVRFPKSLHAMLAEQAQREGVSINTLVVNYTAQGVGMDAGRNESVNIVQGLREDARKQRRTS
jgi:predicted RNase H-like HicB family nuclease